MMANIEEYAVQNMVSVGIPGEPEIPDSKVKKSFILQYDESYTERVKTKRLSGRHPYGLRPYKRLSTVDPAFDISDVSNINETEDGFRSEYDGSSVIRPVGITEGE